MNDAQTTVLLVEDDPADSRRILAAFAEAGEGQFRVEQVQCLADALERLGSGDIDVVLLDLTLPDGRGVDVFDRVLQMAPNALILVLSATDDEETARQAVQHGAHDYFPKGYIDAQWLPRVLHYVVERKIARSSLQESEARFRAMSDASPLGIFVSDAAGNCVYTNAAYHEISGLTFDDALGTKWSMAIHPEDRKRVVAEWHAAILGLEPFQSEARFLRRDGSIVGPVGAKLRFHDI